MRRRNIVLMLVAFTLVLAACASTGSDDSATTTAAQAAATTQAPDTGGDTATTTAAPAATTTTAPDPTADWPEEILFGFIPSEKQEKLADTVQPYMDYLTEQLGITFEGIITADYNGLVVAMGAGNADLGAFGPLGYVQAKELYPTIDVLIQSIRFGSDLYHGQWYTNDPSLCEDEPVVGAYELVDGVATIMDPTEVPALQVGWAYNDGELGQEVLDDGTEVMKGLVCTASLDVVKGKRIAFTSATSTSGGMYPQLQLFELGIDIENDLEYSYLTSHPAAVQAVYNGDFDIGVSYDDARRAIRKDYPDVGEKVIVFNINDQQIPNDIVAVRSELPESLQLAIFDATQAYLDTEEGEAVFDEIYGWTGIRLARDEDFDIVREAAVQAGVLDG